MIDIDGKRKRGKKKTTAVRSNFFITTSIARGLIAENVARGVPWFHNFSTLLCSQELAKKLTFERGGLRKMVDEVPWPFEADKRLVEAVHRAIHNRYGALARQAKQRGENVRFDREFERMRTSLSRAKNAQSLRAELADLFVRGGVNRCLRENWQALLPLFAGPDWRRARDLALFALASYSGKGSEQIEAETTELIENEKEQ